MVFWDSYTTVSLPFIRNICICWNIVHAIQLEPDVPFVEIHINATYWLSYSMNLDFEVIKKIGDGCQYLL